MILTGLMGAEHPRLIPISFQCVRLNHLRGKSTDHVPNPVQRIHQLRGGLAALTTAHPALAWQLAPSSTAIQPLIVGSDAAALALMAALDGQGLSVPAGTARLRITLSAAHSAGEVQQLIDGLALAARNMA
jgi:7-keto-8-aminopelargonate synthetase-like enzyme